MTRSRRPVGTAGPVGSAAERSSPVMMTPRTRGRASFPAWRGPAAGATLPSLPGSRPPSRPPGRSARRSRQARRSAAGRRAAARTAARTAAAASRHHRLVERRGIRLPRHQPVTVLLPRYPAQLAAHHVHRAVPGEQHQVGAQRPGGRVIPAGVAPQLHEHVLHHILRGGGVAETRYAPPVHRRPEPVESLRQGPIIPGAQARREQRVTVPHMLEANAAVRWPAMARPGQRGRVLLPAIPR